MKGKRVGPWLVGEALGEGGVGYVYGVENQETGERAAMKVLFRDEPELLERLQREAASQARIQHPNVVAVRQVLPVGRSPGIIMERVDGGTLAGRMAQGKVPLDEVDGLARGLLSGLAAVHAAGIVHRDLKPGNVLLTLDGVVKVADFGLSRALEREGKPGLTRTGAIMGTPAYMAPEQLRNAKAADQRSDVFSVGLVLYELLTGRRAFPSGDLLAAMQAMSAGKFTPILELRPDAPPRMVSCIERALAIDPARRFPDAEAMLAAWTSGATEAPRLRTIVPGTAPPANVAGAASVLGSWDEAGEAKGAGKAAPLILGALLVSGILLWVLLSAG